MHGVLYCFRVQIIVGNVLMGVIIFGLSLFGVGEWVGGVVVLVG